MVIETIPVLCEWKSHARDSCRQIRSLGVGCTKVKWMRACAEQGPYESVLSHQMCTKRTYWGRKL